MKTIKDLQEFKFVKAGYWFLSDNEKIDYHLENEVKLIEDILYAFESENTVKYIGITEQSLKSRMINYKSGHSDNKSCGFTNKYVNLNIKELLLKNKKVNIYYLKGEADCTFLGLRISLSTGIEKSLISMFDLNNNLWNSRGVKKANTISKNLKIKNVVRNKKLDEINLLDNQTIIKLGSESFNKGIILFKNEIDHLLPLESEGMDIIYKNIKICGWFTRSFKNKKLNGYKELKSIINKDFVFKEEVLVTIINTNEIKIEKIINII